jgi:hypothetical protein
MAEITAESPENHPLDAAAPAAFPPPAVVDEPLLTKRFTRIYS